MKQLNINIICALQGALNPKQINLINQIASNFNKSRVIVYTPKEDFNISWKKNIIVYSGYMNGELFDFSRYQFGIKKINSSTEPILCFNDTLGDGRKLNKPLIAFIIKSIKQCIYSSKSFAAPYDSDKYGEWVCPYFFISTNLILSKLNFINPIKAQKNITNQQYKKIIEWVNTGWRNVKYATEEQKSIKLKTLILERSLALDIPKGVKLLKFKKHSIYRIANAVAEYF